MATPVRIMRCHIQCPGNLASLIQEIRDQHSDVADVTTCIYEVEIACESVCTNKHCESSCELLRYEF